MQFMDPAMISLAVPVEGPPARPNRGLLSFARPISNPDAAALSRLIGTPVSLPHARRLTTPTSMPPTAGHLTGGKLCSAAALNDRPSHAVMCGDALPANPCFRNGEPGLPRRLAVRRGNPGCELAYTLVTSMNTADRRSTERALRDECRHAPPMCTRALP